MTDLKTTADGGFICTIEKRDFVKVSRDGTNEWATSFYGLGVAAIGACPVRDGGFALLYSSTRQQSQTALNYGMEDYWIVRINRSGQKVWDRSYGGIESDEPLFLTQTDDDGFIVGGYSRSAAPSGNKNVVGEGTWCLKLDSSGLKEAEFLIPGYYFTIFPKTTGYSVVGWGTSCVNSPFCTALMTFDLNALRRVSISAKGVDSRPFNLDVSTNLTTWSPFVTGLTGELNLLENFNADKSRKPAAAVP